MAAVQQGLRVTPVQPALQDIMALRVLPVQELLAPPALLGQVCKALPAPPAQAAQRAAVAGQRGQRGLQAQQVPQDQQVTV